MQDDLGVRFGKPETDRGFVLPEPPKTENIRVIHGCRFWILYPNHHAVYFSQHHTSNFSNPLRSCRGSRGPPLFPQDGHGERIGVLSIPPTPLAGRYVDLRFLNERQDNCFLRFIGAPRSVVLMAILNMCR